MKEGLTLHTNSALLYINFVATLEQIYVYKESPEPEVHVHVLGLSKIITRLSAVVTIVCMNIDWSDLAYTVIQKKALSINVLVGNKSN